MNLRGMSDAEIDALNADVRRELSEGRLTMLASEPVLAREWLTPEENEAWAHLGDPVSKE